MTTGRRSSLLSFSAFNGLSFSTKNVPWISRQLSTTALLTVVYCLHQYIPWTERQWQWQQGTLRHRYSHVTLLFTPTDLVQVHFASPVLVTHILSYQQPTVVRNDHQPSTLFERIIDNTIVYSYQMGPGLIHPRIRLNRNSAGSLWSR